MPDGHKTRGPRDPFAILLLSGASGLCVDITHLFATADEIFALYLGIASIIGGGLAYALGPRRIRGGAVSAS